jgi:hypothetical protein
MPMNDDDRLRRYEDRDRMLHTRLEQMEREYQTLSHTVSQLENAVNIVKLEQGHLKDLFSARLSVIEEGNKLQISKIEQLIKDVQAMTSDVDKTPMGRSLNGYIRGVQGQVDEHSEKLQEHARIHADLLKWQDRVEGVLAVLRWIGAGGLIALGISILRMLKILP